MIERRHYLIRGRVQGVGYRAFAERSGQHLGLHGWVRNLADGSVEAEAQGETDTLAAFEALLRQGPPLGRVRDLVIENIGLQAAETSFAITY